MFYNVNPTYDLRDFMLYHGSRYSAVVHDDASNYLAVGASKSRNIFIKTGSNPIALDYALVTAGDVTAKFYKNVYMPYIYTGTITVTAGAETTGDITVTLNGSDNTVSVTAENTAAQVATAIAAVIDALENYAASATDDEVTVTYAATNYVPMEISVDGGDTGVTASAEIAAAATNLTASDMYNMNYASANAPSAEISFTADTIDIDDCINEDTANTEIMLLNKGNLNFDRVLAPNSVCAIVVSNAGESAVNLIPQLIWHEWSE